MPLPAPTPDDARPTDGQRVGDVPVDALLEKHLPGLKDFLRRRADRLVASKESASDLVQSVCREVLQHMDRFEHPSEEGFQQWLYRTAERKVIDRYRFYTAEKRDAGRETGRAIEDISGDAGTLLFRTPSRDAVAREELAAAERAFAALPEHYRKVIVLSRLRGLTHAEIAAQLGKSEGAVRNILYRALAAISDALDGPSGPAAPAP